MQFDSAAELGVDATGRGRLRQAANIQRRQRSPCCPSSRRPGVIPAWWLHVPAGSEIRTLESSVCVRKKESDTGYLASRKEYGYSTRMTYWLVRPEGPQCGRESAPL